MKNELLTVEEVADFLRTTPNTIYRWLRAGKLPGVKLGKEWRIRQEVLDSRLAEATQSVSHNLWDKIELKSNHLMAIAATKNAVYDLEAEFFKRGLALKQRLFKGCWWQKPDEVRQELRARGIPVADLEKENRLVIVDLASAHQISGVQGPLKAWIDEANLSRELGYMYMWGSGALDLESCGNLSELVYFESLLDNTLAKANVVGICPYLYDSSTGALNEWIKLMDYHQNVVFYNGESSSVYLSKQNI